MKSLVNIVGLLAWFVNLSVCRSLTVSTNHRNITGFIQKFGSYNISVFLGIPYAKPPIGVLRFQPPQPVDTEKTEHIYATKFNPSCLQDKDEFLKSFPESTGITSEDCLFLNIFIPFSELDSGTMLKRRVMVWIHGGQFQYGSGTTFNGVGMSVKSGTIVVTFNYRLGVFGFLGTGDSSAPGNWGLLDQAFALKWIHENIVFFGGDPNAITIFGEESGGTSVGLHILSPISRRLFSNGISHGGINMDRFISQNPQINAHILMTVTECIESRGVTDVLKCLRKVDAETLLKLTLNENIFEKFLPTIDGIFLPSSPLDLLFQQNRSRVEYLIGIENRWNTSYCQNHASSDTKSQFLKVSRNIAKKPSEVVIETIYSILLSNYASGQNTKSAIAASFNKMLRDKALSESLELVNMYATTSTTFLYIFNQDAHLVLKNENFGKSGTLNDSPFSEVFFDVWVSFSNTGRPNIDNLTWPSFHVSQRYADISKNATVVIKNIQDLVAEKDRIIWNKIIPNINILALQSVKEPVVSTDVEVLPRQNEGFEKEWGMTPNQVEALLLSVVLTLLFVTIICVGLIRMLLQPPIFKRSELKREQYNSFNKHAYDNDVISLTSSNRQSVTSIELSESKRQFLQSTM